MFSTNAAKWCAHRELAIARISERIVFEVCLSMISVPEKPWGSLGPGVLGCAEFLGKNLRRGKVILIYYQI